MKQKLADFNLKHNDISREFDGYKEVYTLDRWLNLYDDPPPEKIGYFGNELVDNYDYEVTGEYYDTVPIGTRRTNQKRYRAEPVVIELAWKALDPWRWKSISGTMRDHGWEEEYIEPPEFSGEEGYWIKDEYDETITAQKDELVSLLGTKNDELGEMWVERHANLGTDANPTHHVFRDVTITDTNDYLMSDDPWIREAGVETWVRYYNAPMFYVSESNFIKQYETVEQSQYYNDTNQYPPTSDFEYYSAVDYGDRDVIWESHEFALLEASLDNQIVDKTDDDEDPSTDADKDSPWDYFVYPDYWDYGGSDYTIYHTYHSGYGNQRFIRTASEWTYFGRDDAKAVDLASRNTTLFPGVVGSDYEPWEAAFYTARWPTFIQLQDPAERFLPDLTRAIISHPSQVP